MRRQWDRRSSTMSRVLLVPQPRSTILRRLAQLESELRQARADLKNLRTRDPAAAEIVMRGARLSRERSDLERRLEQLRVHSTQTARHSNLA